MLADGVLNHIELVHNVHGVKLNQEAFACKAPICKVRMMGLYHARMTIHVDKHDNTLYLWALTHIRVITSITPVT